MQISCMSAFQYCENMEWDLEEEALDRVHKSNMSKLGLDGKPIRRADGKVLKGPDRTMYHLNLTARCNCSV